MKMKHLSIGAFAAIGLPLIIQSAFAGLMPQYRPELNAQLESTFTLIRSSRAGRSGGLSVPHAQGMRNFARPR